MPMLTNSQLKIIDKYVQEEFYCKKKLIKYLNMHDIVGNEIFDYVDRKNRNLNRKEAHSNMLDNEWGYKPVNVETFIRRIPFYFYTWDGDIYNDRGSGDIGDVFRGLYEEIISGKISVELIYQYFEYMFYEKEIDSYYIFNYITEQTGLVTQIYFLEWVEYLHLCDKLGWKNTIPKNFITAYNMARELAGLAPKIYNPIWDMHQEKPYYKVGKVLEFEGVFPCDENHQPIMKWIGLKIKNDYKVISCTCEKAKRGRLRIEIQPNTVVYFRDYYEGETFWNQVYAGPLTMEFDYTILKEYRNRLNYTQQEVANAVGANLRTYQKWEYGSTQPDGYYLLRLMDWLDIPSIQEAVRFDIPENE